VMAKKSEKVTPAALASARRAMLIAKREKEQAKQLADKKEKLARTAKEVYCDLLAPQVKDLLRPLDWKRASGRGSKGMMVAVVPDNHPLMKLLKEIPDSLWRVRFAGIHIMTRTAPYPHSNSSTEVCVSKTALEHIGVEFKRRKPTAKDKQFLDVLDGATVSPGELKRLLKEKGRIKER
jgi:hypothetical protein